MSTTTSRTVIVCLPAGRAADWSSACRAVAGHLPDTAFPAALWPVHHRRLVGWFTRWSGRHLLSVLRHHGQVTHAAGGRRSRLHLHRAQHAAWYEATARWSIWRQVTTGTRPAAPWQQFLRRHRAEPDKCGLEQAREQFLEQPMVAAMLAYNANPAHPGQLDPYELDAYQAGAAAYATRHALQAVCGQAMLTTDGRWLQPDGDSFADICAYLKAAAAHLHQLHPATVLVAISHT